MLKICNVTKKYDEKYVLDKISLEFPETGLIIIKGENGSGKTTLMNLISALDIPTFGHIIFDNEELTNKKESFKTSYREKYVGFIFQENNLFENMTTEENIDLVGISSNKNEIVNLLQLQDLLAKKVKYLSGGEQQRVAIARVLVKNPKLVLADEPTSSIDYNSKKIILNALKKLSEDRLVLLVSHDITWNNAEKYCDEIIELKEGRVENLKIFNRNTKKNKVEAFSNKFNIKLFASKNLLINKGEIVRNSTLLIISFLFILLSMSISKINYTDMHVDTMTLEKDDLIIFEKENAIEMYDKFTNDDIEFLKQNKISNNKMKIGKKIEENNNSIMFNINYDSLDEIDYHYKIRPTEYSFFTIEEGFEIKYGCLPLNDNEVVISSYLAEQIMRFGIIDNDNNIYKPKSYDEIVSNKKVLSLGSQPVKIVGIISINLSKLENDASYPIFTSIIKNTAFNLYVQNNFFELYKNKENLTVNPRYEFSLNKYYDSDYVAFRESSIKVFTTRIQTANDSSIDNLEKGEIIINEDILKLKNLTPNIALNKIINFYVRSSRESAATKLELKIVGISSDNSIYLNRDDIYDFLIDNISINKVTIREKDKNILKKMLSRFPITVNYDTYSLKTNYTDKYLDINYYCKALSIIFGFISFIILVMSVIFSTNYILNNIDNHKKEIAILKCLGIQNRHIMQTFILAVWNAILISLLYSLVSFLIIRIIINIVASLIFTIKVNIVPINYQLILFLFIITIVYVNMVIIKTFNKIKKLNPQELFKKTTF